MAHILKSHRVEGKLHWAPSLSYSQSFSLPLLWTLSWGHKPWGSQLADSEGTESLGWSNEVVVLEPPQRSWDPGELFHSGGSRLLWWVVADPVIMAASKLGTPTAWRRMAFSAMAGRLVWIATRIWTFSSCACISLLFWRRSSFIFSKRRSWERGHVSYKTRLFMGAGR